MKLPLPRLCILCRQTRREALVNTPRYYARTCDCAGDKSENGLYQNQTKPSHKEGECPNKFETSYVPDKKEIIYCEQCYQQEVT
jgi:hypothetical protein